MRAIINMMIMFTMLYLGRGFFPNHIQIDSTDTMIVAIFWMFVMGLLYTVAVVISALLIPVGIGCLTIVPLIIIGFLLVPFELYMLDKYLAGFTINGFWTYIIFGLVYGALSIKSRSN